MVSKFSRSADASTSKYQKNTSKTNKMSSISQTLNQLRNTFFLLMSKHNSCNTSTEDKGGFEVAFVSL